MRNIFSWLLFPLWIDYERINRKSKGIKGYIQSIVFYHTVFVSIVRDYGFIQAIKLYIDGYIESIVIWYRERKRKNKG